MNSSNWFNSGLRGLGYAAATLAWSTVGFAVLVSGVSVTASLLVLVVGLPVWLGFVHVVRATTWIDRRLAGWQLGRHIPAVYRRPDARGFGPAVRTAGRDPQTWRELSWLTLGPIAGFSLSVFALTATGIVLTWVSLPAWYWAVTDPDAHYGLTNLGMVVVDTAPKAVAVSGVALALVPLVLLLARRCATAHALLAARALGPAPHRSSERTLEVRARSVSSSA